MDVQSAGHAVQTPLTPTPVAGTAEQRAHAKDAQTKEAVRSPEQKQATPQEKNRRAGHGIDITV